MKKVVVVAAAPTPIGDFLGSLKSLGPVDLGVIAVKGALKQAGIEPEMVEELACGMIYQAGNKGNPARQVQIKTGMPVEASAYTIDQQCDSGMKAFQLIHQSIMLGKIDIGLALGSESMSQAPYLLKTLRQGQRMGDAKALDSILADGLICALKGYHMGVTAENLAERYGISRQEQDQLALLSQKRAIKAIEKKNPPKIGKPW